MIAGQAFHWFDPARAGAEARRILVPGGWAALIWNDRPVTGTAGSPAPAAAGNAALPFELRRVASQFPVTLYTGKDCSPCNSGRNLLNSRGIPYVERTVTTPDDAVQ